MNMSIMKPFRFSNTNIFSLYYTDMFASTNSDELFKSELFKDKYPSCLLSRTNELIFNFNN